MADKEIVLLTGLSGAGKSLALKAFEDMGYYCLDNLPVCLVANLASQIPTASVMHRLVVVMDGRDPDFFESWANILKEFKQLNIPFRTLFLKATDDILVRRFSQMRRSHPILGGDGVLGAISQEKKLYAEITRQADMVIDTSSYTPNELRLLLQKKFAGELALDDFLVTITSFGFKRGIPVDADLVFDVRFLPNPYFVPELRAKNGKDKEISDFALANKSGQEFMALFLPLVEFLVPAYQEAGKISLTIAIGCTGGKHRSVAVSEKLARVLAARPGLKICHRDIGLE